MLHQHDSRRGCPLTDHEHPQKGSQPRRNANGEVKTKDEAKNRRQEQNRRAQRNHRRRKAAEKAQNGVTEEEHQNESISASSTQVNIQEGVVETVGLDGELDTGSPHHQMLDDNSIDFLSSPADPLHAALLSIDNARFEDMFGEQHIYRENTNLAFEEDGDVTDDPGHNFDEHDISDNSGLGGESPNRQGILSSFGSVMSYLSSVESVTGQDNSREQTRNSEKQSALHLAARGGHNAVVNALLDLGAMVDLTDERGQTALHHAVIGGPH